MQVHTRSRHLQIDDAVRAHVERRLQFGLDRFSEQILRATVQLHDVNGPRGGEDKVCRIEVRLRSTGAVFVEASDCALLAAIDRAAERAAAAVSRALKRTKTKEREVQAASALAVPSLGSDSGPARRSAARAARRGRKSAGDSADGERSAP